MESPDIRFYLMNMSPKEKIKVCHLVLSLDFGGMENGIINVANALVDSDIETHVLCIRQKGAMFGRLRKGVRVFSLDYGLGVSFSGIKKVACYLRDEKINILYTHNSASLIWGGLASIFAPNALLVHGEHGETEGGGWLTKFLVWKAVLVTSVSRGLVPKICKKYCLSNEKIRVLHNGVDTTKFKPGKTNTELRKRFNIPEKNILFLVVGRLEKRKNLRLVVNATAKAAQLSSVGKKISLLFAGEGEEKSSLYDLAVKQNILDQIVFLGFRDDIPEVLKEVDVIMLPSFGEGMPNVLLEGASSGLPVIASDVSGNNEVVVPGCTGYLLPADDIGKWTDVMLRLATDKVHRKNLGDNAREMVLEKFSFNDMASKYKQLYHFVCSAYDI